MTLGPRYVVLWYWDTLWKVASPRRNQTHAVQLLLDAAASPDLPSVSHNYMAIYLGLQVVPLSIHFGLCMYCNRIRTLWDRGAASCFHVYGS